MSNAFPVASNEKQRLAMLHDSNVINFDSDEILDRYVALAAEIAGTPMAFFNIVGEDSEFTKSAFGGATGIRPRKDAFCAHTIVQPKDPLIVSDLSLDQRFADNPRVTGPESVRFYAGFALGGDDDSAIAALCVLDSTPRTLSASQIEALKTLSLGIASHIQFRKMNARWNGLRSRGANQQDAPISDIERQRHKDLLIAELERATARREFVNYYQPKIDVKTRKIAGVEALIRWPHAEWGTLQPLEFVGLLEETGLIIDVGFQVFEQALADWKAWSASGLRPPQIAVNVASQQFLEPAFVQRITTLIADSGFGSLNPLSIELTESSLIANLDIIAESLRALQAIGVPIALDDFGTGFSSLAYIATLPIDVLKIDRSFIRKMTTDPKFMGLVTTIINLAHSLEMKVVAEGVENNEEANLLRLLRCEQVQGFLYSEPIPATALQALLTAQS